MRATGTTHAKGARISRVALGCVAALGLVLGLGASCFEKPPVSVTVLLPASLEAETAWIEIGAFTGACPEPKLLAGGMPTEGPTSRVAFRRGEATPPAIGDLPKGQYAFVAVARREDCAVVASGCQVVDVKEQHDVSVRLDPYETRAGACSTGQVCSAARCIPTRDTTNPSIGAQCSLQLLGAGPLTTPLVLAGDVVSPPAIAATPRGFLIGYREYIAGQGAASITLVPVDPSGGAGPAQIIPLPNRCVEFEENDATAMAFLDARGLVAVSRAPCGGQGGIDLFEVDPSGAMKSNGFSSRGAARVTLGNAHALAPLSSKNAFLLAFTSEGQAHVATVNGLNVPSNPPTFGGAPPLANAWVGTSDGLIALVAGGSGQRPIDPGDAGDDAEAGPPPLDPPDGGASSLRVQLVSPGADLSSLPSPLEVPGSFAAVAAQGTRAYVVSDATAPGRPAVFRVFDLGAPAPTVMESFETQGSGKLLFADVVFQKDRAIFAVEQPGSISLIAYDLATTAPARLREVFLPSDPRIPSMKEVRDGNVAIAATSSRVAIAWTTGRTLTDRDALGGYAIFACTTP
jgi:hypothetical protein